MRRWTISRRAAVQILGEYPGDDNGPSEGELCSDTR